MKKISLIVMTLFLGITMYGQDTPEGDSPFGLPTIVPPSPTVANLMQFEEVPVEYYTGQPSIGIPLFSKTIHKGISLGLSLQYNTQGVKVDSRSGWTGTGWSLFAGGSISRTVRGFPDESSAIDRLGVLHNPDFWNYNTLSANEKQKFIWNSVGSTAHNNDTQLDLYQFNFLGFSGRFVVTNQGVKLLSNDPNVKITYTHNPATKEIHSFKIVDTNGYIYYFNEIESSETIPFNGSIGQGSGSVGIVAASNGNYTARTAWHLSKVTTSNNLDLVNFNYQTSLEEYVSAASRTYNTIISTHPIGFYQNNYNPSILKPKESISYTTIRTQTKKIASVVFRDNTSVSFQLGGTHPETNGTMLTNLIINNADGTENKRYHFTYEQTDRLWLTEVEEKPITGTSNSYKLSYTNTNNLASFDSESDPWGFNYQTIYNPETIKAGLLSQIQYPTGGVKEFVFEEHTFSHQGNTPLTTEDYYLNPDNIITQQYAQTHPASISPQSGEGVLAFSLTHNQEVDISLNSIAGWEQGLDRISVILSPVNDPSQGVAVQFDSANETMKLSLTQGDQYLFLQHHDYNIEFGFNLVGATVRIDYHTLNTTSFSEFLKGGGVRIKEVVFKDTPNTMEVAKRVQYDYNDIANPATSSGVADIKTGSLENRYELNSKKLLFSTAENSSNSLMPVTVRYSVRTKGTNAQMTKGGYIGYSAVKMSETNNGYSIFSYTSPKEYPTPASVFIYPFAPAPNLDFKRGLLVKQEVYDNDQRKLQETENTLYNFVENTIAPSYKAIQGENCEWIQFYGSHDGYLSSIPSKNIPQCSGNASCIPIFYNCGLVIPHSILQDNLHSGWTQLKESVTKSYFYDSAGTQSVVETKQEYDYNTINYQPKQTTRTITEAGNTDIYVDDIYYAVGGYPTSEYTTAEQAVITKMNTLNMITAPIYTKNTKNSTVLGTVQQVYKEWESNMIAPHMVKAGKSTETVQERLAYHKYDSYGNPLEVSQTDGSHIIYIWGYKDTYPIAKIANASYTGMPADVTNLIHQIKTASDTENTASEEAALRSQLQTLQDHAFFANAQMSYYTYDPLIGVTSVTDPRGYQMSYTYDRFNRVEKVKDAQGNILSENAYHYKNN
ncbi:RHS repeat domain-containing protein [Aquimarina sp. 2201CG14-23]|uniref:RHS repeat domain-containing protein n=1 Tax=Aquimarina mycalae TaxID=3040073 RepID=UPI002477D618|nr:RHS repeat domain-containing protein [Aquimarina sp. 2201CG14-23]MDH7447848.1 RHS repeat protein [Aquimarina sp. 2201CG14-23]